MDGFLGFLSVNLPVILCLIAGIALVTVEIFLPGFGIAGIAGFALMVTAIALTWSTYGAIAGLAILLVTLALGGIAVACSVRSAAHGKLSRSNLILKGADAPDQPEETLSGAVGTTATALRPSGFAVFDGQRISVSSQGEYIDKDKPVRVIRQDGLQVFVSEIKG